MGRPKKSPLKEEFQASEAADAQLSQASDERSAEQVTAPAPEKPPRFKLISGSRYTHTNPLDTTQVFYPDPLRPTTVAELGNWHKVQIAAGVLKQVG